MITLKDHLKYLVNVDYNLDFRDLYHFHNDTWKDIECKGCEILSYY